MCKKCVKKIRFISFSDVFDDVVAKRTKPRNPLCNMGSGVLSVLLNLTNLNLITSQKGFEPLTDGLEGRCSILLSYWDIFAIR